jgi:SAM-dependent methyltransferase
VARGRAAAQGISNVEFRQLELEWIDLPTADVDAVLCRWGIMLVVDSEAAAQEIRRVLRPSGRAALAVWDEPARNPWATVAAGALIELGALTPAEPGAPDMFKLAGGGVLRELLETAGLIDVEVTAVAMERRFDGVDRYLAETLAMSSRFRTGYRALDFDQQREVKRLIRRNAGPFTAADGSLTLPGSSLVARAEG